MTIKRQDHLPQRIGHLRSYEKTTTGVTIHTDDELVDVVFYTPGSVRIRTRKKDSDDVSFSYAVVATPGEVDFSVHENDAMLSLSSSLFTVKIDKAPIRFSFLTLEGAVINEEDEKLGTMWIGHEVGSYRKLQSGERFIGLGEKTGNLDRAGKAYQHWNSDSFAYAHDEDPLYLSTPFYMGIHSGLCYGIFFDNTYRSVFNFGASNDRFSSFTAPDGEMDYYFIHQPGIGKIIEDYTHLTGRPELPPLWSLGFQQCRYSYYPQKEVMNIARNFREREIPADVIYLDIHYMDQYKVFTWDNKRFPDPDGMVRELKEMGFHVILIVDPGVKVEEGYPYYDEGLAGDLFAKYPDGSNYTAKVWPGWCHFPDFTNPKTRDWWGESYKIHVDNGIEGYWNDMNEPATWGKRIPDIVQFEFEGHKATIRKANNVYGMQMARSTFEGVRKQLNGKRPFVLSRAGFSGIQRYAAVWTGDNIANDEHMMAGIRMLTAMGLTGIPFCGYDVGGFAGEASNELFARWISIGAFSPFYRAHSMINSRDAEPWAFGEEVEEISKNYINLRYRLLPYLYSCFYETAMSGMPIQRSLAIAYPHEKRVYAGTFQNQYLFGPNILVAPVASTRQTIKVYLPEGDWYDLYTDRYYNGDHEYFVPTPKERLPVFVRGGGVVLMQNKINHTKELPEPTLEIHLYNGTQGDFLYFEDDGETYEYASGNYYRRHLKFDGEACGFVLSEKEGSYKSKFTHAKLYFHGFGDESLAVHLDGQMLEMKKEHYRFIEPISDLDPWHFEPDQSNVVKDLPYTIFALKDGEMKLNW